MKKTFELENIEWSHFYAYFEDGRRQWGLCCDGVHEYFNIPKKHKRLWVIVTDKKPKDIKNAAVITSDAFGDRKIDGDFLPLGNVADYVDTLLGKHRPHPLYVWFEYTL